MIWNRKGLIFDPSKKFDWAVNHALQPTPLIIENKIRLYCGFRDNNGVSRIGFVEVNAKNPLEVIGYSKNPVLDIGEPGTFDEFGVVPTAIIKHKHQILMYYAGYQLGKKVRFLVLGGLAVSNDDGNTFIRHQQTPIFERTPDELLFRVPHTVINDNNLYRIWYGGGSKFETGNAKTLPVYNIRYLETDNPFDIPTIGSLVLNTEGDEYRLGRPFVIKDGTKLRMFYGYSSENKPYQLGYSESLDNGFSWTRKDAELNLPLSNNGWDSEMMAYPSIVQYENSTYLFYNGNSYGINGFGFAELVSWD